MTLINLFLTFFKIGLFTVGGGYAMIPVMQREIVDVWQCIANDTFVNFIGIAESTPGPIAINMATFVGFELFGVIGSIVATFAVVLPSFIIILVIASLVSGLMKFAGVRAFLGGVRPIVVGLIIGTGITLLLSVITSIKSVGDSFVFDWKALVIFAIVAISSILHKNFFKKAVSPIILILISAVFGMLLYGVL